MNTDPKHCINSIVDQFCFEYLQVELEPAPHHCFVLLMPKLFFSAFDTQVFLNLQYSKLATFALTYSSSFHPST